MNNFEEWTEKDHPECYYGRNIISTRTRFLNYKARRHPQRFGRILRDSGKLDFTLPILPKNMGIIGHIDHGRTNLTTTLSELVVEQQKNVIFMNCKEKTIEEVRRDDEVLRYLIPESNHNLDTIIGDKHNDEKEAKTNAKNKAKRKAKRKSQKRNKR